MAAEGSRGVEGLRCCVVALQAAEETSEVVCGLAVPLEQRFASESR